MNVEVEVRDVLGKVLQLGDRTQTLHSDSRLLGALPELDSMAVVAVITQLEEHFGVVFDDDEISANTFTTLGNLVELIRSKQQQS